VLQQYYVLPLFTLVRFGRWSEILTDALPPDVNEPYPLAIWHYSRGTAFARTGRLDDARRELGLVESIYRNPTLAEIKVKNINPAEALVRIAALTLRADIALADHAPGDAVDLLEEAKVTEDALAYDEPHLWLAPARQALGAALLAADRAGEAETAYRDDLAHYPENPWSLAGLAASLRRQGLVHEAIGVERRLREASKQADVSITRSRF
jgi:tetratricopeptide (TPR) repeat protein